MDNKTLSELYFKLGLDPEPFYEKLDELIKELDDTIIKSLQDNLSYDSLVTLLHYVETAIENVEQGGKDTDWRNLWVDNWDEEEEVDDEESDYKKFKVGDRVRIIDGSNIDSPFLWLSSFNDYIGKCYTINFCSDNGTYYGLKDNENIFYGVREFLELADEEEQEYDNQKDDYDNQDYDNQEDDYDEEEQGDDWILNQLFKDHDLQPYLEYNERMFELLQVLVELGFNSIQERVDEFIKTLMENSAEVFINNLDEEFLLDSNTLELIRKLKGED